MSLIHVKLLGIKVCISPKSDILKYLEKALSSTGKTSGKSGKKAGKPVVITTPNPEQLMLAQGNPEFRDTLNKSDVAIPDGIGLVWAARILGLPGPRVRVAGSDLLWNLAEVAEKQGVRIGLIGGRDGVALKALECLQEKYPGLKGAATEGSDIQFPISNIQFPNTMINNRLSVPVKSSSFEDEIKRAAEEAAAFIGKHRIGLVLIGMGAPKQEYLIREAVKTISHSDSGFRIQDLRILMSVGGAFDMLAGRTPRAPIWAREIGLEWLWRLIREPWRLRRQLALPAFALTVIRERVKQEFLKF